MILLHRQLDELRQKLNVPKIPLTNEAIMTIGSQLQVNMSYYLTNSKY